MKLQNRFMKLLCLVLALTIFLPGIPAQAATDDLETGYHASTTFAEENAVDKAFDNDPATRWSACADKNQWICAIFENEVVINSVEILEFWDRMNSFEIQYLDENGTWQTCASKTIEGQDTGIDTTHQLSFAPVRTTGMRLYIHDAPNWASIYEFKMFYGGVQIMDGKSAAGYHASTTFVEENAVDKAFDNDPATRWSACADQNQWICAIFDNEVVINSVEILEFWDRMNSFEIQYLDENGIWQTCASKTVEGADTGIDTTHQLSFAPVRTTGMRLYIHDAPNWASIYEFKMFYGGIQIMDGKSAVGYHASTTFVEENAVDKAFDNDPATRWSACADQNQWICAIFENEVVINSVEILEFWDRMNSFEIQYLDENGTWQTCASKTIEGQDTGIDTTHQLYFAPVKTTGMRLYIHDAPNWASIYEFKMFYGGVQIMDGKSAVGYHASTTFAEENAVDKAFDNDPATRWSACADQNQWICAIFENEVVINSVEILEFWDRMNSFEIQYLDENGTWQTCASKTIEGQDTGIDTTHQLSFAPVKTTGMRLYIHDAPNWASIYEFKMFYSGIQLKDGMLPEGYYASTTFGDEHVSKAFDNDPATRWSACAEQNQWICAIFENEVTIDCVEINEFWDRMNSFEIQYLDENGIWQTCASKTVETEDTGIDTTHLLSFGDVTTSGIRLYIHDAPGWPSIYEFKMFNDRPAQIEYVAQVDEQSYATVAEAIANANGDVVKMLVDSDEAITVSDDVTIDLAGNSLSNVTVSAGKMQFIDSLGDGSANVTGTVETFTEADGKNYLVVGENGVYSAHEYSVTITHISLNAAKDALGYRAKVIGDEVVQTHVKSIGFNLWVDGGNTKVYETAANNVTLRLQNIMKFGGGEMNINATAFVILAVGEQTATKTSTQQTTTMKQTLQTVNEAWATYSEVQKAAVKALCDQYYGTVSGWKLDAIFPSE